MSLLQYGFQQLVLLNSAGYSRAELPLDESVSLVAPNNTGKTSLINALQFLLIVDKRHMDFGAHSFDNSRKFYFPDNSAYILLEVLLSGGMAVIGCVGKGLSHDYEYFAYQGALDPEDFRLPDGNLVTQPKLIGHLTERGKLAKIYVQADLKALLYGNRQRLKTDAPDLTVFPLEMPSLAPTYQRILTRTLRLDRLDSKEVKQYLLEIFQRDLTDRSVDFKSEWEKSFADVNSDKANFDAVSRNQADIEIMRQQQQQRKILRGQIIQQRPLLEQALNEWQDYYRQQRTQLEQQQQTLAQQSRELQQRLKTLIREQSDTERTKADLQQIEQRCQDLHLQFAIVKNLPQLQNRRDTLQKELYVLVTKLENAHKRTPEAIKREIRKTEVEFRQWSRQLATLENNLYLRLQKLLPEADLHNLNRLLAPGLLSLSAADDGPVQFDDDVQFQSFAAVLQRCINNDQLQLPGLCIDLSDLTGGLSIKTAQELQMEIDETRSKLTELKALLTTAEAIHSEEQKKQQLEQDIKQLDNDIQDYRELLKLQAEQPERLEKLEQLQRQIKRLQDEEKQFDEKNGQINTAKQANQLEQGRLQDQFRRIDKARNQRRDQQAPFDYLSDLPHLPVAGEFKIDMQVLAELLENYNRDCAELIKLDGELDNGLKNLHLDGVVKFQYHDNAEQELESLFKFTTQLTQEKAAIERKARSAVVQVAAILRELRDGLETLKRRMNDFNKLINKRPLSDLKVFKIEAREEEQLVDAIKTLISTSEQVDSGESFDLFDHATVLDDTTLDKAKDLLIREGEARGSLRVEHLFRLVFILAKENQNAQEYENMDSAASNGTVLMAKLITGLAMLNLMQDSRKQIHTACYLDEAASLDQHNQRNLIATAKEFGFALIFASPEPQITARYCVPITNVSGSNRISRINWQILEPLESAHG